MKVKITSGLEIPPRSKWETPLSDMVIGDSFECTMTESNAVRIKALHMGMKVVTRTVKPGIVRVWRTE